MSDSVVYFDKKGEKFNLEYLKQTGRNGYPVYYVYAKKDKTKDDILGACEFVISDRNNAENEVKGCFIRVLDVEREYIGRGLGSFLLKAIENVAISQKATSITTKMPNDSVSTSNLYVKNGYGVSGYLAFKDKLEHHDEIVDEPMKEVVALSDDDLHTL